MKNFGIIVKNFGNILKKTILKFEWGFVCQNGPAFGQIACFYLKSGIYSENGLLHLKWGFFGKTAHFK